MVKIEEYIIRCDVCGVRKASLDSNWKQIIISIDFRSENSSTNAIFLRHDFRDLCPKCNTMMTNRIKSALNWAVTL